MPGMLNSGTTTSETVPNRTNAMAGNAPQHQGAPNAGMGKEATPEQKQQFNQFVDNAQRLIYDEQMMPRIQEGLQGGGDPASGLAQMAGLIILRVANSAYESGVRDPGILVAGGAEVIDELAELSSRLGIHEFSQEEMNDVTKQVVQNVIAARDGANQGQGQQGAPEEMPAGEMPMGGGGAPGGAPMRGRMPG